MPEGVVLRMAFSWIKFQNFLLMVTWHTQELRGDVTVQIIEQGPFEPARTIHTYISGSHILVEFSNDDRTWVETTLIPFHIDSVRKTPLRNHRRRLELLSWEIGLSYVEKSFEERTRLTGNLNRQSCRQTLILPLLSHHENGLLLHVSGLHTRRNLLEKAKH